MRFHEIVAAIFCVAGVVVLERMPVTYPRSALLLTYASPIAVIFVAAVVIAAIRRRNRALVMRDAKEIARACVTLALVLAVSFLLKSFIHLINPRVFDRQLFALDRQIHFGYSPTIFLVTLFDQPLFLRALDAFYTYIYYALFIFGSAAMFALLDSRWRFRYGAAFVLMWVTATIFYLLVPSWGPAFSATSLVEPALRHMPRTVWIQSQLYRELSTLIQAPLAPRVAYFGGVAAFPSLHVACVALLTIASRHVARLAFVLALIALVLMLFCSVISGYHFLLDGYAGILIAAGAWWLAGAASAISLPPRRSPPQPLES
ncbi:MAG TPA: phosphatase PAP2 family protein [Thermoanaerobaculia bacterium]|nr:phosphatase PAP2 family protein [Thermoanaerobaculia bacterium]